MACHHSRRPGGCGGLPGITEMELYSMGRGRSRVPGFFPCGAAELLPGRQCTLSKPPFLVYYVRLETRKENMYAEYDFV